MTWKTKTLAELCKMYQPQTLSKKQLKPEGKYSVYGANGIIGKYNKYNHEETQLLVTCRGATCGSISISEPFSWINGNAMVIQPNEKEVSKKYIEYYFKGVINFSKIITGSAQPQITRESLNPVLISYPPLPEQQQIVTKLDKVLSEIDNAITNSKKTLSDIKNLNNKVFDRLLDKNKCQNIFLNDICKVERGSSPRPIKSFLTEKENGVNWIKIGDTKQDGKYISSTKQKITKDGAKKSKNVKKGDFVLTNSMSYGRPYIMSIDGCIHDGWFVLRLQDDIDKEYFYYLLSSSSVQNQFKSLAAGSVVKNISGDLVKKTMLLIPSKKIQIEIKEKLSIIDKYIQKISKLSLLKINNYQKLKLSIFNNLINLDTKRI